ncbi:hypothetical protein [Orlajensenia leifsoniae]|uniref:Uncharacterized protein n=1 Tax=Orlajensenia leifsoniae TaxID=2561933 RepID=A0A4Y9R0Z2_9MICO|nr:hypothetical protein [Leifsonia flava]TFV98349.1 hypothetical protein E4M00_10125 [Leifsonia flava]
MTQTSAITPVPKTPWYRRTAPPQLGDLATGLWFMGHAQLYLAAIGLVIGVVGVVGLVGTIAISIGTGAHAPFDWPITAMLALPFAAAFLFSGLTLRVVATIVDARATPVGRAATTLGMMVLMAGGAYAIVAIGIGIVVIGSYVLAQSF